MRRNNPECEHGMAGKFFLLPEDRGVVSVAGEAARPFLQGLVSNDVDKVSAERAVYAAMLTPQGRFLHDFFIAETGGALHLDCEAPRLADLARRLKMYRLRAKVAIEDASAGLAVALLFGEAALEALELAAEPGRARPFAGGVVYTDPRLAALGARAILPREGARAALEAAGFAAGKAARYDRLRLSLGVPDGSRDLPVEQALLMENGFEALNGLDWDKGCYVGQELTARMKYRALVKKQLLPVAVDGPLPEPGTPVLRDGAAVGEMRSGRDGLGLALLKVKAVEGEAPLIAGDAKLSPRTPAAD